VGSAGTGSIVLARGAWDLGSRGVAVGCTGMGAGSGVGVDTASDMAALSAG
jgi:hypothetical protein